MFRGKRTVLWTMGGLALGLGVALVVGVLVFWVQPALRKAQSPLGEVRAAPIVLRYPKGNTSADVAQEAAEKLRDTWFQILEELGLRLVDLPAQIYVYAYHHPQEIFLGLNERLEQENVAVAVVDLLFTQPAEGALGRLACALALGRPGNTLFPRGLARVLENPGHPWEEEAGSWLDWVKGQDLWTLAQRLLPPDPWETWYFTANAPWAGLASTMETQRALWETMDASSSSSRQVGEVFAAALARWVLEKFGPQGIRIFWTVSTWEAAASLLGQPPEKLASDFQTFLSEAFLQSPNRPYLQALRDLQRGKAEAALGGLTGAARASALLALGRISEAVEVLGAKAPDELKKLAQAPRHELDNMILIGEGELVSESLAEAHAALTWVQRIWHLGGEDLPDRIVFYVGTKPPGLLPTWGTLWISSPQKAPEAAARLGLQAVSPWGLPSFATLVEGLVLYLGQRSRDFRAEAQALLRSGKWASLTQPLFGVYPRELAEAEAGAFVALILERFGEAGLREFWAHLEKGASPFRACEEAFGLSLPALDQEIKNWLTQL